MADPVIERGDESPVEERGVDPAGRSPEGGEEHLLDDLLVEEVSIDGMCGVY